MGTSQRYKASVSGQPNWGRMTAALMSLAASEAKDEELAQEESELEQETVNEEETPERLPEQLQHSQIIPAITLPKKRKDIERRRKRLNTQLDNNLRKSVSHAVRAAGGKKTVTSGRSSAFGYSGVTTISNFVGNIVRIVEVGLDRWLEEHGKGGLQDKSPQEVVTTILEYSKDTLHTMDSTAAGSALETLNELLKERLGDDVSKFNEKLADLLVPGEMTEFIDVFFADYIYGHLSSTVYEKLQRKYGLEKAIRLMEKIRDQIREDVKALPDEHHASSIDWKGQEGQDFMEHEFNRVISIYVPDENNN